MLPPAYHLQVGSWQALQPLAESVRLAVFVHEQGIALSEEWDDADASAVHAVVTNAQGQAVATGRLLPAQASLAQVGRMAVLQACRGRHLGAEVLQALCDVAHGRGDRGVLLHAQRSAEGFYARYGFVAQGEPYDEVGIPHITMVRRLP